MTFNGEHKARDGDAQAVLATAWKPREGRLKMTARQAEACLAHHDYGRQRRTAGTHVDALAEDMRRGKWAPGSQIVFARLPDGALQLVNGRHRLAAQIESGLSIDWQITILDVQSQDEVNALYFRFDTLSRKRSASDIIRASGFAEDRQISGVTASRLLTVGVIIYNGLRVTAPISWDAYLRTPDGKLSALEPWMDYIAEYDHLLTDKACEGGLRGRLTNSSVIAAAAVTLKYQHKLAIEFWGGIAANDGLRRGDPRHTFIQTIQDRSFNSGMAGAALCISALAWNAFFKGENRTVLKIAPNYEAIFLGTPFDGRRRG